MGKTDLYSRYIAAVDRLDSAGKQLVSIRSKLENINVSADSIGELNSIFAEADQILNEYHKALAEFKIYDHAGSYAVTLDVAVLNKERAEMVGILKRVANKKYSRDQVKKLAKDYLARVK